MFGLVRVLMVTVEAIMFKHLTANGLFPNGGLAIVSDHWRVKLRLFGNRELIQYSSW